MLSINYGSGTDRATKKAKPLQIALLGSSTITELHLEGFFFNLHSIAEHILTEHLLIIEILLQVIKLEQFQEKI